MGLPGRAQDGNVQASFIVGLDFWHPIRGERVGEAAHPGPTLVDVVTLNCSGRPQLDLALSHYRHTLGRGVSVGALLLQEHHARGNAFADMQAHARRGQWQLHGAAASLDGLKAKLPTAGVAVAAPCHVGLAAPGRLRHDVSPIGSPGRVAAGWVDTVVRGGISTVHSPYMRYGMYSWMDGRSRPDKTSAHVHFSMLKVAAHDL